jgi:hypothetical protein
MSIARVSCIHSTENGCEINVYEWRLAWLYVWANGVDAYIAHVFEASFGYTFKEVGQC